MSLKCLKTNGLHPRTQAEESECDVDDDNPRKSKTALILLVTMFNLYSGRKALYLFQKCKYSAINPGNSQAQIIRRANLINPILQFRNLGTGRVKVLAKVSCNISIVSLKNYILFTKCFLCRWLQI